jgi:hypothetical protein
MYVCHVIVAQFPSHWYEEHWHIGLDSRSEFKALLKQQPECKEAIRKIHSVLNDTASLVGCIPKKTGMA